MRKKTPPTTRKTATGATFNANGTKLFTIAATGQFWYNGSSNSVTYADGGINAIFGVLL
ncbi:hypothetical protein [Mechercharimyces sp. CAU 1602]|uniref:hypothetical protein n=1 Tax=Mechercharimyces sp. CAU 1602 TaxID=2973933 RepID=UPI0021635330|nr:hypothetical protein [Mechercharimyces sp. CAU 1602]